MDLSYLLKVGGNGEHRKTTMEPMRVHEMDLGLPKSVFPQPGKTPNFEPIRVGPLLEALEAMERSCSKTKPLAQRKSVAPAGTGNVRRQIYNEAVAQNLPNTRTAEADSENSDKNLINDAMTIKSQAIRLGLSKSDGKVKMNGPRNQPVKVKLLMESWEKSQTAKRAGQKSVMSHLRSVKVRRQLYSVVSSPAGSHKVAKKSLPLNKPQETAVKKFASQKTEIVNKTGNGSNRKSFLLPPNSIRQKYVSQQVKPIIEESPTSPSCEKQNMPNSQTITEEIKVAISPDVNGIANLPEVESLSHDLHSVESVVADESQQSEKVFKANIQIPRPSVIMGLTSSTVSETQNQSDSSECSSKSSFALPRPPLQELNKNSTMPVHRVDAVDTSLEDLLGNSQENLQYPNTLGSTLPCDSLLRSSNNTQKSLMQMDRQTLLMLHEKMKLSIQTMEESLSSMKIVVKLVDDIISSETAEKTSEMNRNDEIPAEFPGIIVTDHEGLEKNLIKNDCLPISLSYEDEAIDDENKENFLQINGQEVENTHPEKSEKICRRSIRLAGIQARSMQNLEDSFSRIEKELNIGHDKSISEPRNTSTSPKPKTVDPRSRRSIREYMALKSSAKFLQTPDHKSLPTKKYDKTGTPAQRWALERAISQRVLNQLDDLYDESSE